MDKSDYNGVYEELVELLGVKITLKIHEYFKGQQVNFPMRVHSKKYVEDYLRRNYDGNDLKNLSKEIGYITN